MNDFIPDTEYVWDIADVGNVEVRTTHHKNGGLLVYPYDGSEEKNIVSKRRLEDFRCFVLIVGTAPSFRVIGYMFGGDARNYRVVSLSKGKEPAHRVPQSGLSTDWDYVISEAYSESTRASDLR
jgi:hypothetical protein